MLTLLGLDPGKVTGFAVFEADTELYSHRLVEYGVINAHSLDRATIDVYHHSWLLQFAKRYRPADADALEVAFEETLLVRSLPSDGEAAEVRGIIRTWSNTDTSVRLSCPYRPATVKKLLVNNGNANKKLVAARVKELYGIKRFKADHEPDAIAVGICHLVTQYGLPIQGALDLRDAA